MGCGFVDVVQDQGADALERAEVRENLEMDSGVEFFLFLNDSRDVVEYVRACGEEVGEYGDFGDAFISEVGDGRVDLRAGDFEEGAGHKIKCRTRVFPDSIGQSAYFVVRVLAAASVGDNQECFHGISL